MKELIYELEENRSLSKKKWIRLIEGANEELADFLFERARRVQKAYYGNKIYIRGLIEFTNYCKNDCFYCGIRKSNSNIVRYRLGKEEILSCCAKGYELGFRTFVLQGGEDGFYTEEKMCALLREIKKQFPECAITLSIGEKEKSTYEKYYNAGADRYLLRHETYDAKHYRMLHPVELSPEHRQMCLFELKDIGYQVGSGFMVGSPGQTAEHLAMDMLFLEKLHPHMVGIGPFITQKDTPFREKKSGTLFQTLYMLGLLRLMLPEVLLPATTALGSIATNGRKLGILAGANVVMPNLSPLENRKQYSLYDHKRYTKDEAAEGLELLRAEMKEIGYQVVVDRGDSLVP